MTAKLLTEKQCSSSSTPSNRDYSEARDDDENRDVRMPKLITLGQAFQVDSTTKPMIIEDMTGYEVIRGRFKIIVAREASMPETLVHGEQICQEPPTKTKRIERSGFRDFPAACRFEKVDAGQKVVVAQAQSILKTNSLMSDVTFGKEDEIEEADFQQERLIL